MNDKPCIIEINNTEYYYPCDYKDSIIQVGSSLVNTGSSQITLYRDFPTYGDNTSGYPRIVMPSNTKAYVRNSQNAIYSTLVVNSVSFNSSRYSSDYLLSVVLLGVLVCLLFKR